MKRREFIIGALLMSALPHMSFATEANLAKETQNSVVITNENFIHADSARAYLKEIELGGKVNTIRPIRVMANTDNQDIIRMNSDTLYTKMILDVKGGATVTTKEYGGYQNILVLDPNHSEIKTLTGYGTVTIDETMLTEGHHAYVIVRTGLIKDLPKKEQYDKAHKAQDKISITYKSSEPFVPAVKYDFATLEKVKYKIFEDFALHPKKDTVKNGFGTLASRDPESARTVVAVGWGGLSGTNAVYSAFTATGDKQSMTIDKPNLHFDKGGFFSMTIYNMNGYIATMKYALNSDDMVGNKDGTITLNFIASGESTEGLNNVVITPRGKKWSGVLRAYYPKNKDETFAWADSWTAKMAKEFNK
jgi:hypothetical protein